MDKFVTLIAKSSKETQVQCKTCGAKSPVTSQTDVEEWSKAHKCGEEPKVAEEPANETLEENKPPVDPEPTDGGEEEAEEEEEEEEAEEED